MKRYIFHDDTYLDVEKDPEVWTVDDELLAVKRPISKCLYVGTSIYGLRRIVSVEERG